MALADPLAGAEQLYERGLVELNEGRPRTSRRTLRRALALLAGHERPALAARILISLALVESELFGVDHAEARLREAADYAAVAGEPAIDGRLHIQRGSILMRAGRFEDSLGEYDRAVEFLDALDAQASSTVLLNRGVLHLLRSQLPAARADLDRAAQLAEGDGLPIEQFKALHNLGYVEFLAGDLPDALRAMDAAAELGAPVSLGVALLDRARVLVEAGLDRDADAVLVEAAAIFERDGLRHDLGDAELARAECAILAGEAESARELARRARARFARRGNARSRRRADLLLAAADLLAGRVGDRLVTTAQRLAAEFSDVGERVDARTAALLAAEAQLALGRLADARAAVSAAGPAGAGEPVSARLHTRYVRARLAFAAGDRVASAREVRTGLAELARYQASFGSIDLRTSSALPGRRLAELGVLTALRGGRPLEVLAAIERGRAVSSRLPPVRPPLDQAQAALLGELRQVVEDIRAAPADPALHGRRRELERRIRSRSWMLRGQGEARRAASPAEIRGALEAAGSTLVAYIHVEGDVHAVRIGGGRPALRRLGRVSEIDELVRRVRADLDVLADVRLPGGLAAAARASLTRSLRGLDDLLLTPVDRGSGQLLVAPTGSLATLPWGMLPSLRGRPVVVTPTATAWLSSREHAGGARTVTAIAGPGLDRAGEEIRDIATAWGGSALDAARRTDLAEALAGATVVHVAAHGVHSVENPLFSSVRLVDGPLFAHELDSTAAHVVLSACDLGLATVRPGDEALGLTSVLLQLGTRSVVSGVARVADAVAAELMVAYHRQLAVGRGSAEALASVSEHAAVAPFVCFGTSWHAPAA